VWSNDLSQVKAPGSLLTKGPVADVAGSLILTSSTITVQAAGGLPTTAHREWAE
jgi:hypothetical protein